MLCRIPEPEAALRPSPGEAGHYDRLSVLIHCLGHPCVQCAWTIDRTTGWLMLHRRLARDCETLPESSEAMTHLAMIDNVSKRITDEAIPTWRGTY
jgi:hypothetical protein